MVMARNNNHTKKSNTLFTCILFISIFVFGMLVLGRYSQMAEMNRMINRYNQELTEIKSNNGNLFVELTRLRSVDRIEGIALGRLGMEKASTYNYVFVTSNEYLLDNETIGKESKNPFTGIFSMVFNFLSRSAIWEDY